MHPPSYTDQVLVTLANDPVLSRLGRVVVAPPQPLDVLSAYALRQAVEVALGCSSDAAPPRLIIWAFSAGCVGAAALANAWQRQGSVLALFMVDGWGVPRVPGVPVHRLSHDRMTHDTSRWLGAGDLDFYADPGVPHLQLWQQPQAVEGWALTPGAPPARLSAADFLCRRSRAYLESRP
ncbi:MAG: hypothetical protein ACOYM4_00030 [Nodosilinea sp.]